MDVWPHLCRCSTLTVQWVVTAGTLIFSASGCQPESAHSEPAMAGTQTPASAALLHDVAIRQPPVPSGVITAARDARGEPVALSCQACHSVRLSKGSTAGSAELDEFHQGLQMSHGRLTCVSCHNPADGYASLRLADGRSVPFAESMTLCAQCHGQQFRDYQRGAHGGMTGHWDLTRGGRTRNHCLHCHDPHAPKYPTFMPVAGPRDRFPPVTSGEAHE